MAMHDALHPKRDTDNLCLTKEKGGLGLIADRSEKNNLRWCVRNSAQSWIRGVRVAEVSVRLS